MNKQMFARFYSNNNWRYLHVFVRFYPGNNWRRLHGYPVIRLRAYGRRKRLSQRNLVCVPFPDSKDLLKKKRFKIN